MLIEEFIFGEIDRMIKFLVWWNYKNQENQENFPLQQGYVCWTKALLNFDSENPAHRVPKEYSLEDFELSDIRKDLIFQLQTLDELDWNYLLETVIRGKVKAEQLDVNMAQDQSSSSTR